MRSRVLIWEVKGTKRNRACGCGHVKHHDLDMRCLKEGALKGLGAVAERWEGFTTTRSHVQCCTALPTTCAESVAKLQYGAKLPGV